MKRFVLSLLVMMAFSAAFSQRQYFIYLQAEPEQAFFVKMNEKIHSSTASGYLILSRLKDSSYSFSIGFPQNKWPEQKFIVDVKGKDRGYLLKNFGEKGWGLYDLQTMGVQMGESASNNTLPKTEQKDVSVFTDILSKAANDPSLKEKPVTPIPEKEKPVVTTTEIKEEKKIDTIQAVVTREEPPVTKKEDSTIAIKEQDQPKPKEQDPVKNTEVKTPEIKTEPVEEYKRSVVRKKSERSTSEGLGLVFIDDYGKGKKDTISIFIPNQKVRFVETKQPVKEEKKFLDISDINNNGATVKGNNIDTVKKNDSTETKIVKETAPVSKNKCAAVAEEADFFKLRKKMAAETNDEAMVDVAKKTFKTKCFTTSQIKNLSTLFLNDNGKYKFFDAAYTHVSDDDNFPGLQAELKDEYYINRFKAMLRPVQAF